MQIEGVGETRNPHFEGGLLRAARDQRGWSQGRLAAALDVALPTIRGYERGSRTPPPPTLLRLARALEIAPEDLMTLPRPEWSLADFRVVAGLHQHEAADRLTVGQHKLSRIEAAYERVNEQLYADMATLYAADETELRDAWDRARSRLMDDNGA